MKVNVSEDILFYAFRYVLGRKTYAVGTVVDALKANWLMMNNNTRNIILNEIASAIETGDAGMSIDEEEWASLIFHDQIVEVCDEEM